MDSGVALTEFQRDPPGDAAALWPRYDAVCRRLTASSGAERLSLLGEAGGLARAMRAYPQAAKHYARAIELAAALGDATRLTANTVRLGVILHHGSSHPTAPALAQAMNRLLPIKGFDGLKSLDGLSSSDLSGAFCLELAIVAFETVLQAPDIGYHDFALQHLAKLRVEQGLYVEAQELFERALALRKAKGDPELIASTRRALKGLAELDLG